MEDTNCFNKALYMNSIVFSGRISKPSISFGRIETINGWKITIKLYIYMDKNYRITIYTKII